MRICTATVIFIIPISLLIRHVVHLGKICLRCGISNPEYFRPPPTTTSSIPVARAIFKKCVMQLLFFFFCFFIQSRSIWSDCFRIPPLSSQITICNSHRWRDANLWWINYLINHRVCRFCWFLQNKNIYGWRKKVIALFSKIAIYSAKMKGIRFFSRNKNLSLHFFLYQLFWGTIRYVSHND